MGTLFTSGLQSIFLQNYFIKSQNIHALRPKLFCIMPLCHQYKVRRASTVEVVEIALVCLNYERMTFRAVALESIAFEVDCSLKVFVPQGGTGPSPKCPSESGIFVFLIGLKALVQKDTSLLFDFMSVIHEGHCC